MFLINLGSCFCTLGIISLIMIIFYSTISCWVSCCYNRVHKEQEYEQPDNQTSCRPTGSTVVQQRKYYQYFGFDKTFIFPSNKCFRCQRLCEVTWIIKSSNTTSQVNWRMRTFRQAHERSTIVTAKQDLDQQWHLSNLTSGKQFCVHNKL